MMIKIGWLITEDLDNKDKEKGDKGDNKGDLKFKDKEINKDKEHYP